MPLSRISSDYLVVTIFAETDNEIIARFLNLCNEFPEGSARRMEMEAAFFENLAKYVRTLAGYVREQDKVTLYDED